MTNRRNCVKSVFVSGKSNKIYYEYYDDSGVLKQKSTKQVYTKENMKLAQNAKSGFEEKLWEKARLAKIRPFSYYAKLYIQNNKNLSKIKVFEKRLDRYIDFFGGENVMADEITRLHLKSFFANMEVERDTKKDWLVPLRGALDNAVDDSAVNDNIARSFILPKQGRLNPKNKRIRPFSPDEARRLLDAAEGRMRNYLGIGIFTGMRPEEIIALMIGDIDFKEGTITIERAISKKKLKVTKTDGSNRTIPLFRQAEEFLHNQIAIATEYHSLFLFSDVDGNHLSDIYDIRGKAPHPDSRHYGSTWYKLLEKIDMPIIDLRNTRHTFAVRAIESGKFSLRDIQKILGHSSLEPIYQNYAKWIDDDIAHIDRNIDLLSIVSTGT